MTNVLTGRLGYSRGIGSLAGYFNRKHRKIAVRKLERVNMLHLVYQRADGKSLGGVPARLIRKRFAESVIEDLLAIAWWHWDR